MRDEYERPPAAQAAGEADGSEPPERTFTATAARPEEGGAARAMAPEWGERYSPHGIRQERSAWSILEALSEARETDLDDPDFFAEFSDESAVSGVGSEKILPGIIVPATADGLSAVLGDLADLALDDLIAEYDALERASGGQDA